ncbi:MAG: glycosyltransferase family 4 protein [Candidatus Andersenbacteria bacterium]
MTNVCIVSLYAYRLFHPDDIHAQSFSGSEIQQYYLGTGLAQHTSMAVSFLVGDFYNEQPSQEEILIGECRVLIYKTVKCGRRNIFIDGLADFWKLWRAMKKTSADVYIVRGGGSFAGKVALVAKGLLGRAFIYSSAHDRDSDGSFFASHPWYINWLFSYALRTADAVVCQHKGQRLAFQKNMGIKAMPINTMYPVEPPHAGTAPGREYLLWVGRLVPSKQPEILIRLAEHFPHQKFMLVTNSDPLALQDSLAEHSNITVRSQVPFAEIDGYFQKALLFVNTSLQEGFPNTYVQAAKWGVPIAALQVNPDNILHTYAFGKAAGGDFLRLTADIGEILSRGELRSTMSERAYQYAREHHNLPAVIKKYQALLQSLIAAKP